MSITKAKSVKISRYKVHHNYRQR